MTTQNTAPAARTFRYSPIFTATVTPGAVEVREGTKGPYTLMQGSTIAQEGKEPKTMTVMAFGKSHSEVSALLVAGTPVELAVQFDGGSLKVIGLPREKVAEAA